MTTGDDPTPFLKQVGLYVPFLKEQIKQQLIAEQPRPSADEALSRIQELDPSIPTTSDALRQHAAQLGLTIPELAQHLAFALQFRDWCQATFTSISDSLFIKYKRALTRVSYSALQCRSHGLAIEIYHELEAGERAFEDIYIRALLSSGDIKASHTASVSLSDLLDDVAGILLSLPLKTVCYPKMINDQWVLFRVEMLSEPQLDEPTRRQLCLIEGQARVELAARQALQG